MFTSFDGKTCDVLEQCTVITDVNIIIIDASVMLNE